MSILSDDSVGNAHIIDRLSFAQIKQLQPLNKQWLLWYHGISIHIW